MTVASSRSTRTPGVTSRLTLMTPTGPPSGPSIRDRTASLMSSWSISRPTRGRSATRPRHEPVVSARARAPEALVPSPTTTESNRLSMGSPRASPAGIP